MPPQQRRGHYNRNDEWVDDEEDQVPPMPVPAPGLVPGQQPVPIPMPQARIAPNVLPQGPMRQMMGDPPVIADAVGGPAMQLGTVPVPGGNWLGPTASGTPHQPIPALDALMSAAAQNYRQWTPGVPYPNVDPDMISSNPFRAGGGGFVHNPGYAPAMAAYANAVGQYGQGMGTAMNTAAGQYGPALMQHTQAQGRLGHDMAALMGFTGPGGQRVPGTNETHGLNAWGTILNAQNTRYAADVQRDQFILGRYNEIRRQNPGREHPEIVQQMIREGMPQDRIVTALAGGGGLSALPPWMTGQGGGVPSAPGPSAGQSSQPPMPGVPAPRANAPAVQNPLEAQPPGGLFQEGDRRPPQMGQRGRRPPVPGQDFGGRLTELMNQALLNVPTQEVPGGQGVPASSRPVPYTSNQAGYHNAITQLLQNLTNEELQQNMPEIMPRLIREFGGEQALNNWLQTSNIPINTMSHQGQRQQEQIQRLLRLANMRQTPIGFGSSTANWPSRILGGVVNNTVGLIPGFTPGR